MAFKIVALSLLVLVLHLTNSNPVVDSAFETEKDFNLLRSISKIEASNIEDRKRRAVGASRAGLKCFLSPSSEMLSGEESGFDLSSEECDLMGGADYCVKLTSPDVTIQHCGTKNVMEIVHGLGVTSAGCKTLKASPEHSLHVCLCNENNCNGRDLE